MSFRVSVALAVAVLTLSGHASADTVVLTNRVEYRGAIVSEDASQVTILSDGMQWTFSRDKVASIKHDKATAAQERARNKRRLAANRRHPADDSVRMAGPDGTAVTTVQSDSNGVTVYGTSWCGYCRRARAFFHQRGVPFVDKDVEQDPQANREMHRKCAAAGVHAGGVPMIDVFGMIVAGFDQERIEDVLKRHGY